MPVFRYFLVMGCCLLGLIVAAGWMWPNTAMPESESTPAPVASPHLASAHLASTDLASTGFGAESAVLSSIDDWRRSEGRFERSKQDPKPIVYPDVATLAPTAHRLQWERQLRYLPENHVYEARAEMPKGTAVEPPKVAEKTAPRRKHIAHARSNARTATNVERPARPLYARNTGWSPFGLFD